MKQERRNKKILVPLIVPTFALHSHGHDFKDFDACFWHHKVWVVSNIAFAASMSFA